MELKAKNPGAPPPPAPAAKTKTSGAPSQPGTGAFSKVTGLWSQARTFLKEVRVEMTKVTWPSWEELRGQTIVVIIAVLIISAFIGIVDLVLSNTYKLLIAKLT